MPQSLSVSWWKSGAFYYYYYFFFEKGLEDLEVGKDSVSL